MKSKLILNLFVGSLFIFGCGQVGPSDGSSRDNLVLADAPVNTLILAQRLEKETRTLNGYGYTVEFPILETMTELEFDADKTSKGLIFVGRVLDTPSAATYPLYGIYANGVRAYGLWRPGRPDPYNVQKLGHAYMSAQGYFTGNPAQGVSALQSNGLAPLCRFQFGWAICPRFPNQPGQTIAYIFYTTQEDRDLGRNI